MQTPLIVGTARGRSTWVGGILLSDAGKPQHGSKGTDGSHGNYGGQDDRVLLRKARGRVFLPLLNLGDVSFAELFQDAPPDHGPKRKAALGNRRLARAAGNYDGAQLRNRVSLRSNSRAP